MAKLDPLSAECEQLMLVRDRSSAATAILAVHDTRLGPAHGGIRRWPYAELDEALRDCVALARAMTWKCALAEVPAGGGKAVILDHAGLDRVGAYRLVGRAVQQLGGRFFTGPDVNTTEQDLRVVAGETEFVAVGGDAGPGDLAGATAEGVVAAMGALVEHLGASFDGLHVAVQGLGAVGLGVCERLAVRGVRLTVSDIVPGRAAIAEQRFGATVVDSAAISATPCDVFAPCALGGVLDADVAAALSARGVCGAANNVFAGDAAAMTLHRRGVVVVPDVVANAGALILGATWHLTGQRAGPERVLRIGATAREVLARAAEDDLPPSVLAHELARERVERGSRTS